MRSQLLRRFADLRRAMLGLALMLLGQPLRLADDLVEFGLGLFDVCLGTGQCPLRRTVPVSFFSRSGWPSALVARPFARSTAVCASSASLSNRFARR